MPRSHATILKLLKDRSGLAMVEFGILASIFLTLIFAIIDFGLMMWLNNTVEHVAAEGARYAAVRGADKSSPTTAAEIVTFVQNRADGIPAADMTVSVTWPGWPGTAVNPPAGSTVTVLVTYNYEYIIGSILGFDPVDLQGRSTMIVN